MTLELQYLKKGKEVTPERWKVCSTKYKWEVHYKDECPVFRYYITSGAPNPVNLSLWCDICRTRGQHHSEYFYLLQIYIQNLKKLFYNFYRSVGDDDKNFWSYDLMMDHTADSYRLQDEGHTHEEKGKHTGLGGFQGWVGGAGWGCDQITCHNYVWVGHFMRDCQNPMKTYNYCKSFDHVIEERLILIVIMHEKRN